MEDFRLLRAQSLRKLLCVLDLSSGFTLVKILIKQLNPSRIALAFMQCLPPFKTMLFPLPPPQKRMGNAPEPATPATKLWN